MSRTDEILAANREPIWGGQGIERAQVVRYLRYLCAQFGDNDWEDNLHLEDVIEKHLMRYLYEHIEHLNQLPEEE
jgi:predicted secreted protein